METSILIFEASTLVSLLIAYSLGGLFYKLRTWLKVVMIGLAILSAAGAAIFGGENILIYLLAIVALDSVIAFAAFYERRADKRRGYR